MEIAFVMECPILCHLCKKVPSISGFWFKTKFLDFSVGIKVNCVYVVFLQLKGVDQTMKFSVPLVVSFEFQKPSFKRNTYMNLKLKHPLIDFVSYLQEVGTHAWLCISCTDVQCKGVCVCVRTYTCKV